jgi:hypothetical protein
VSKHQGWTDPRARELYLNLRRVAFTPRSTSHTSSPNDFEGGDYLENLDLFQGELDEFSDDDLETETSSVVELPSVLCRYQRDLPWAEV